MKLITTAEGVPTSRYQRTPLQVDFIGALIDKKIYSQTRAARMIGVSPQTLSQHLRGHRKNPLVLHKILKFIGRDPLAGREPNDKRGGKRRAA